MQTTRHASLITLLLGASLLLSGCGSGDPEPTAGPSSSAEPVFASEEEALAAAEEAFAAYLAMADLISQEGFAEPERIKPFVTEEWLPAELKGFAESAQLKRRQEGGTDFHSTELQQVIDDDTTVVIINTCLDFSQSRILDPQGPVDLSHVPPRSTVEVTLESRDSSQTKLILGGFSPWHGKSC